MKIINNLIYASEIKPIKHCLSTIDTETKTRSIDRIINIENLVTFDGIYTVITKEEFIVVQGIITSPFAGNHMLAHNFYNLLRIIKNMPFINTFMIKDAFIQKILHNVDNFLVNSVW